MGTYSGDDNEEGESVLQLIPMKCHDCHDTVMLSTVKVDETRRSISFENPDAPGNRQIKRYGMDYDFRQFTIVKCDRAREDRTENDLILCSDCIRAMLQILESDERRCKHDCR